MRLKRQLRLILIFNMVALFSFSGFAQRLHSYRSGSNMINLESGINIYSVGEIAYYPAIELRGKGLRSVVVGPLFITDENILRWGGTLGFRQDVPSALGTGGNAFIEFGMQYFEIKNGTKHFRKTFVFTEGIGLKMDVRRDTAVVFMGAGVDFGGPFVKERFGFTGILRVSYLLNELYKF